MLYCPERRREFFYVLGDVNRPGAIEIPPRQEVLASRAISLAGGPTRTARMGKGLVVRYSGSREREDLAVDFQAILRGKKSDFPIRPNDVIYIPGSTVKTLLYGFLGVVPGVAHSAALVF